MIDNSNLKECISEILQSITDGISEYNVSKQKYLSIDFNFGFSFDKENGLDITSYNSSNNRINFTLDLDLNKNIN
jgi:hypothetical protein